MSSLSASRATALVSTSVLVLALFFPAFLAPLAALSAQAGTAAAPAQQPQETGRGARTPVVVEGEVEVLIEDYADHSVRVHVLRTPTGRVPLRFRGKPPDLLSGASIRVSGDLAFDGAVEATSSDVTPLALAPGVAPGWVFGDKKVLVILFKFTDTGGDPYPTGATSPVNDEVNSFYVENSYGQTSLTYTVTGWHTVAWPTGFGCDFQLWGSLADNAATNAGYDLAAYDRRVYAYPYQPQCGFRGVAFMGGPRAWVNGTYDRRVVAHELGHTYGLDHSKSLVCDATGCVINEYGDLHDTMGAADLGHFNAFQKERIGWLNYGASPAIETVNANGQYGVEPMSTPPGSVPKALKIFTTDGANDRYIYVEQRVQSGVDSALPPGVTVHTGVPTDGASSRQIDLARSTTADDRILDPGESITFADANPHVTIQTVSSGATGAIVTISLEGGCTYAVSPLSASFPGYGGTGAVTVTAGPGCDWNASSSLTWLRVTGSSSGTGNGTVEYVVDPNPANSPRTGSFTVAGRTVNISQANAAAGFISPTDGASILGPAWTFQWTDVPAADHFRLAVGTTPGGADLVNETRLGKATSFSATNLPVPSRTLYARIRTCWTNNCSTETTSDISFKTMDRLTGVTLLGAQTPGSVAAGGSAQYGPDASGSVRMAFTGALGNCSVSLSTTGLPAGAAATFGPQAVSSASLNEYSLLTISTTSATPAGSHPFTITAQEAAACGGVTRTASATLVVAGGSATTALIVTPATGTYGGAAALSATLTSSGTPVSGKTVAFTVSGNAAGSAVTNASGIATVAAASLAGIAAGSYPSGVGAAFAGDGTHGASNANSSLTVNPKVLSPAVTAANKVYDGTTTATLTGCTLTGVVGSDVVSCAGTGSGTFDTAAAGTGKTVTATGLALTGAAAANYVLSSTTATATAAITPRAVTVTAAAKSKQYGDADPAWTYAVTSGSLLTGDVFTGALTRAAGETVGTYAIQQGTLALSSNYALTYVGANLTIGPRAVTVTADAKTKTIGDTDPALTYQLTTGSLVTGDSFTGALTRAAGEAVGSYAILQGTLALNSNYTLTYVGATLTIGAGPISSVTLTADRTSPQQLGASVTFTAAATGGTAPYQFKWWLFDGVTWTAAQPWSTSTTFTWTPTANGTYQVWAFARSAGNTADAAEQKAGTLFAIRSPVTGLTLSADRTSPQLPGTNVTFMAAATGGTAPYEFKWWLYDGATWTVGQNWSTATSFTWTPTANGTYQVWAFVRSAGSTADAAEQMAGVLFAIRSLVTGLTLTADRTSPQQPGTSITFTTAATGGVGPVEFKWWLFDGTTWTVGQNWSTATTFTWTPTANGTYQLWVFARSAGSTTEAGEQKAGTSFAIQSLVTGLALTANLTSPQQLGTSITFTAVATGGVGPVEFKWWLYDGTTWTVGQNWTTATSFAWTPAASGSYQVWVFARSAGSATEAGEQKAGTSFHILSTP